MQVQLIVTNKQQSGQVIPVDVPAFRIGQAEDCHLRSRSSQISPQHCVIHTHGDAVTVLDLGGASGTYVNGVRITAQQELKDGDKLTVGKHSFVLSIKAGVEPSLASNSSTFELLDDSLTKSPPERSAPYPVASEGSVTLEEPAVSADAATSMQSDAETEQEAEIMFEVRYKGQNVSVTKKRLFEMAQQGAVSPDDIVKVAGTKVFADSIHGIVFGNKPPADVAASPPSATDSETRDSRSYAAAAGVSAYDPFKSLELEKNAAERPSSPLHETPPPSPSGESTAAEGAAPFDTANEPVVQIARVPGARKEVSFSDLGKPLEEPLNQASTWMSNNITRRHVTIAGSALAACFVLAVLVFLLIPEERSSYGAVRVTGTLTLDGTPVVGAGVILHPRSEDGRSARGATDRRGRFVVGTGTDSPGRGAIPGEYDVTFLKRPEIPSRYEAPETSRLTLRVEPSGRNSFSFALLSTAEVPQHAVFQGAFGATPPQAQPQPEEPPLDALVQEDPPPLPQPLDDPPPRPDFPHIWAAAARGTPQSVEAFLREGVCVNERDDAGNTPLHFAARSNPNVAVVQFLLVAQSAEINARNNLGETPLHLAAQSHPNENVLRTLINQRADGAARNNAGQFPWGVANTSRKRDILFEAYPPPPNIRNIIDAAARGTAQHVDFFVRRDRADVNQRDGSNQLGNRVIHVAAESNDVAVLEYLIDQGADVNARNNTSNTPLHLAARSNPNVEVLRHLITRGANVNARNEGGRTPWDLAVESPEKRILLFREGGRGGGEL